MYFIKVIIAIVVALGFWRGTGKDTEVKTENSSLTKTMVLFILTMATALFYYKTHQVATLINQIYVEGIKGSYHIEKWSYDDITAETAVSKDKIISIDIFNSFSNKKLYPLDPAYNRFKGSRTSGLEVNLLVDKKNNSTKLYPGKSSYPYLPSNIDSLTFCYDVDLWNNTIPSLFPISLYENWKEGDFDAIDDPTRFHSYAKAFDNGKKKVDESCNQLYVARLESRNNEYSLIKGSTRSNHINALNFFSAADLSQCQYLIYLDSDIPIDKIKMYFDIPIELTNFSTIQSQLDSREFSIEIEEDEFGEVMHQSVFYHVKFPTLANLQLIRSLILTTLLTALISVFFINLYYYCRKKYLKRLQKHPLSHEQKETIRLVWIPAGKIIVWSVIILSAIALILSMINHPIKVNGLYFKYTNTKIFSFTLLFLVVLTYCVLICLVLYFLHRRKIYLTDIKRRIKQFFIRIKKSSSNYIRNRKKTAQAKRKSQQQENCDHHEHSSCIQERKPQE